SASASQQVAATVGTSAGVRLWTDRETSGRLAAMCRDLSDLSTPRNSAANVSVYPPDSRRAPDPQVGRSYYPLLNQPLWCTGPSGTTCLGSTRPSFGMLARITSATCDGARWA